MHWQTHTVFNQPIPLNNSNLYLSDGALCEAVTREGAGWDSDFLASIGQQLGTAESLELGRLANVNPPELLRYDAQGRRLDDVRFHPAWHFSLKGKRRCCFVLRERGTGVPMPKKPCGRVYLRLRQNL